MSNLGIAWTCVEAGTTGEPGVSETGWEELFLGNIIDDKADANALRYSFHTVAEWTFTGSGVEAGKTYVMQFDNMHGEWYVYEVTNDSESPYTLVGTTDGTSTDRVVVFDGYGITASRWLLSDRAVNSVTLTADATLMLPASAATGKARDLVVRLAASNSPTVAIGSADAGGAAVTLDTSSAPSLADGSLVRLTEIAQTVSNGSVTAATFKVIDMNATDGLEAALHTINYGNAT